MAYTTTRRGFLAASAAIAASTALPRLAFGQSAPLTLLVSTRVLEIDGRAARVYGLTNGAGGQGLILDPAQQFRVDLTNSLDVETIIHWHGQLPPNAQDGVPDLPMPLLKTGETRSFDYAPNPGTHWMHSHVPVQEMNLLAAPLIVRSADDVAADRQEVVMFLHDFSFRPAEEVLAEITGGTAGHDMAAMGDDAMAGMDMGGDMAGMDHSGMDMSGGDMSGMAMDLNDFNFDAYLANDRTLADPEIISVEKGGRVRLRIVNAAAATTFWIDTGVPARLVAVDGHAIVPIAGTRFGMTMAQRLDIEIDLPGAGAFPVLALREGARERTGLILATTGAQISKISGMAEVDAPAFDIDMAQEMLLQAANPLADRAVDRSHMIMLAGSMKPYLWTIGGQTWDTHKPLVATSGERVELMFHNMSMMGHPMHLHGHVFQVVNINGRAINGAMRDTVYVPPMARVTVLLDAGEAARWMLHCHHMPHLSSGMMTEFAVSA
ncbi:multicopper oxidase family protein [Cypionkella psychrotolerans]|uniref:multicopper oxidase family protein n=1 Tax=Cypionkella psychrotolerans TaxID=1678131 RepID=UPI0006B6287A|nr:multicopper oxidase family protein [Cypionkella psychrotolerans]